MTTTYDATAFVKYDDDLESGFVVTHAAQDGSRRSYWYGPDHGWSTTFGPLDGSVAVFDSKVKARNAIRTGYGGGSTRLKVMTIADARLLTADSIERYAIGILARVARLRGVPRVTPLEEVRLLLSDIAVDPSWRVQRALALIDSHLTEGN